jgi:phage tail assembly protein T
MKLAREFGRHDWRTMLAEMSSTELSEWGTFYSTEYFQCDLTDSHFARLSHLITDIMYSDHGMTPEDFSLLTPKTPQPEADSETLMSIAESISGGKRYGPASG